MLFEKRAYAFAKACGIIGKSFVGKRMKALWDVSRLSDLDRLIFPASFRDLPEKELLIDIEDRIALRSVSSIMTIAECFDKLPDFFVLLLRAWEYADLKNALIAAVEKESKAPAHTDLGRFGTVNFNAWPDIPGMIKKTDFEFLLDTEYVNNGKQGYVSLETALDRHYYDALWKSLSALPMGDKRSTLKIIRAEISLKDSVCALRLRRYYGMKANEVKPHLIDLPDKVSGRLNPIKANVMRKTMSLSDDAVRSLDLPLDNHASWSSWRWKDFLNPDTGVHFWQADPQYFQNAASRYLYRLAKTNFRLRPFSLDSIFCFIKIKQFEEDILTSVSEGLGMKMAGREVLSLLGVES